MKGRYSVKYCPACKRPVLDIYHQIELVEVCTGCERPVGACTCIPAAGRIRQEAK